jgi:hypothetical protein
MTTRQAPAAEQRAVTRALAALLTCVLAVSLIAITRSHGADHHAAHGKPVVGISMRDFHQVAARLDQHAVAADASAQENTHGVRAAHTDPITPLDARRAGPNRVRGPPRRDV